MFYLKSFSVSVSSCWTGYFTDKLVNCISKVDINNKDRTKFNLISNKIWWTIHYHARQISCKSENAIMKRLQNPKIPLKPLTYYTSEINVYVFTFVCIWTSWATVLSSMSTGIPQGKMVPWVLEVILFVHSATHCSLFNVSVIWWSVLEVRSLLSVYSSWSLFMLLALESVTELPAHPTQMYLYRISGFTWQIISNVRS